MALVGVSGDEDQLFDSMGLPPREDIVQCEVERLLSESGRARIELLGLDAHTIVECRGSEDPELCGEIESQSTRDVDIRAEGEVRPRLLEGTDRNDQHRISLFVSCEIRKWMV